MSNLTVALIQQSCSAKRDANVAKTIAMIREAKEKGARLVLLQFMSMISLPGKAVATAARAAASFWSSYVGTSTAPFMIRKFA